MTKIESVTLPGVEPGTFAAKSARINHFAKATDPKDPGTTAGSPLGRYVVFGSVGAGPQFGRHCQGVTCCKPWPETGVPRTLRPLTALPLSQHISTVPCS